MDPWPLPVSGMRRTRVVILGLCGLLPATVDPNEMDALLEKVKQTKTLAPEGHPVYRFDPAMDLIMDRRTALPGHANGMAFEAYDVDEQE